MSRSSACWSASCSGIAGLRSAASPASGQPQLLQPFFGLALAGLLPHEPAPWTMALGDRLPCGQPNTRVRAPLRKDLALAERGLNFI